MPLIEIHLLTGRTDEQKKALLSAVTSAVHESIGAPLETIRVWVQEFPPTGYMAAGILAADGYASLGWNVYAADEIQEGRFPRPGRPGDGDEIPFPDFDVDSLQGRNTNLPELIFLLDRSHRDNRHGNLPLTEDLVPARKAARTWSSYRTAVQKAINVE